MHSRPYLDVLGIDKDEHQLIGEPDANELPMIPYKATEDVDELFKYSIALTTFHNRKVDHIPSGVLLMSSKPFPKSGKPGGPAILLLNCSWRKCFLAKNKQNKTKTDKKTKINIFKIRVFVNDFRVNSARR